MQILNLQKNFEPLGPGTLRDVSRAFPSGFEPNVRIEGSCFDDLVIVTTRIREGLDFLNLNLAVDALHRKGADAVSVFVPFFPCSRQDRVCHEGEALSLQVLTNMLITSGVDTIFTFDLHSLKDNQKNIVSIPAFTFQRKVLLGAKGPYVTLAADEGAHRRYGTELYCKKSRIEGSVYSVDIPDYDYSGKMVYIIDDICDGGATFLEIAKKIRAAGKDTKLGLIVSHGIFSKNTSGLSLGGFDEIHTTDSIVPYWQNTCTVHPLYGLLKESVQINDLLKGRW